MPAFDGVTDSREAFGELLLGNLGAGCGVQRWEVFVEVDGVVMTGPAARMSATPAHLRHAGRPQSGAGEPITWA